MAERAESILYIYFFFLTSLCNCCTMFSCSHVRAEKPQAPKKSNFYVVVPVMPVANGIVVQIDKMSFMSERHSDNNPQ